MGCTETLGFDGGREIRWPAPWESDGLVTVVSPDGQSAETHDSAGAIAVTTVLQDGAIQVVYHAVEQVLGGRWIEAGNHGERGS